MDFFVCIFCHCICKEDVVIESKSLDYLNYICKEDVVIEAKSLDYLN